MQTENLRTITTKCDRCAGTGRLAWAGHYAEGRCFACHGGGSLTVRVSANELTQTRASKLESIRSDLELLRALCAKNDRNFYRAVEISDVIGDIEKAVAELSDDRVTARASAALAAIPHRETIAALVH